MKLLRVGELGAETVAAGKYFSFTPLSYPGLMSGSIELMVNIYIRVHNEVL